MVEPYLSSIAGILPYCASSLCSSPFLLLVPRSELMTLSLRLGHTHTHCRFLRSATLVHSHWCASYRSVGAPNVRYWIWPIFADTRQFYNTMAEVLGCVRQREHLSFISLEPIKVFPDSWQTLWMHLSVYSHNTWPFERNQGYSIRVIAIRTQCAAYACIKRLRNRAHGNETICCWWDRCPIRRTLRPDTRIHRNNKRTSGPVVCHRSQSERWYS